MAAKRENADPEQTSHAGYFGDPDPDAPAPEPTTIVIDEDPGGVGDGGRTPGRRDDDGDSREGVRRGDKKIDGRGERAPPNPPRETPRSRPGEGVSELNRQLEIERAAKERAERDAAQALARASQAEARYGQAAAISIDSAMEAASRQSEQAQARYIAALDISDHPAAAKAQAELSDARFNLMRLQEQKQIVHEDNTRRQQTTQAPQGDNLSATTAQLEKNGFRKSAEWLREHPDMVRDQDGLNRINSAHGYVVNVLKIPVESDRYFDQMESILLDGDEPEPPPRREPRRQERREDRREDRYERREPQRAAPASRSAPRLRDGATGPREVFLTSEQRAHARDVLGMTDREYAESLADAEDRGKLLGARR